MFTAAISKPKYDSVQELQAAINNYFSDCEGEARTDEDGNIIFDKTGYPIIDGAHPPTVTGLALWLGFNSRQAFLNYKARSKKFDELISMAKSKCEEFAERHLYDHSCSSGAKFALENNFNGWGKNYDDAENSSDTELSMLYKALTECGRKIFKAENEETDK